MPSNSLKGKLAKEYLLAYPTTPTLAIARMLLNDNPKVFTTLDDARGAVRYHRDEHGTKNKKAISMRTEEQMIKLCHYTNLQPLWALENIYKADKVR